MNYNSHIIYRVYLHVKRKIIQIKDLKVFINAEEKTNSHIILYNIIAISKNNITNNTA